MADPRPLPPGTVLAERFEIQQTLGRGGFGIAYRALDHVRLDQVVVKELAPMGLHRASDGVIELGQNGDRLRQSFLNEARTLAKLNVRGVLPVRAYFAELGTAYHVTEFLADSRTLDEMIRDEGPMTEEGALDIFYQVLETLEGVHERGILHRDIKPSNILVDEKGLATLIDFGSAREWHADSQVTHTVQFTPGYAPPEQMSERARRGPATDLYALSATLYHTLVGEPPPSPADRMAGVDSIPLRTHRPDLELAVASAIDRGLALAYSERPQTAEEFKKLLSHIEEHPKQTPLEILDDQLVRLKRFSFNKRACPACGELLIEARPLRRGACPVCHEGAIRRREIHERRCPVCKAGVLHLRTNQWPTLTCPSCAAGILKPAPVGLMARAISLSAGNRVPPCECPVCRAHFQPVPGGLSVVSDSSRRLPDGDSETFEGWLAHSGRSHTFKLCDGCGAQFDCQPDGRVRQMVPKPRARMPDLYPEEWARIASGLDPGAGNAECERCGAEYYLESDRMTLLATLDSHSSFAETYRGRLVSLDAARWLGVGKESPNPGFVCEACPTEFDWDHEYLRLVRTNHARLARFIGQPKTREDWQRIAHGLPTVGDEDAFQASLELALRDAYREGSIGFDDSNTLIWRGPATKDGQSSTLTISPKETTFGGPFRRWRVPTDAIESCEGSEDCLQFRLSGHKDEEQFELSPVELVAHLKSGDHAVTLDASDLAARLKTEP